MVCVVAAHLYFLKFLNVLLNKSNRPGTVELHVVQLIVIHFRLTAFTDLIFHYFNFYTALLIKLY